ncbi:TerB N-terminal domain-containing protein [Paenibacillus sp. FSL R5-0810]|uniref:TerB N-terminal domain-containing protein n=1 Tax=Paenibacillus sp. FSL R5-0810 TaxID=2921659 RepID=UPI0030F863FE
MKNEKPDFNNNKNNHIEHIRHTTLVNDQGIRFAEIEFGGEERDMPLAARSGEGLDPEQERDRQTEAPQAPGERTSLVVKPQQPLDLNLDDSFRYLTKEQQFALKARELAWHTEDEAPFVPFKTYWPTYEQMRPEQFRWYFYWREEVRSGRYPDTDLSYLFLYFYELIHGVGWSDPRQGYDLMLQAWNAYRERYAKLDMYLREWLYDFMIVHHLDMPIPETYDRLPRAISPELKEREYMRRFSLQPAELTWELLCGLLDYDAEKSRFYQESGRKDMQRYAPKVVALVDSYLAKKTGQRFIDRFQPRPRQVKRYLFRSAVYDHGLHGRTVVLTILSLSEYAPLRAYMTGLIRLTENKLRELRGFKGRLRGTEAIGPDVAQLVERYLTKEIEQQLEAERKKSIPEVQIDTRKLRRLQRESDEVRDMLLVEGAGSEEALDEKSSLVHAGSDQSPKAVSSGKRKPKSVDVVQAVMDFDAGLPSEDSSGMEPRIEGTANATTVKAAKPTTVEAANVPTGQTTGGSSAETAEPIYKQAAEQSIALTTVETTLDTNIKTIEEPIEEPFEETTKEATKEATEKNAEVTLGAKEIPHIERGSEAEASKVEEASHSHGQAWQWDVEDDDWQQLAERLTPVHMEILHVLKAGPNSAALQPIAERAGSMPALLLDEINEAAMDTIGDLLIDGESIAEEYIDKMDALKRI